MDAVDGYEGSILTTRDGVCPNNTLGIDTSVDVRKLPSRLLILLMIRLLVAHRSGGFITYTLRTTSEESRINLKTDPFPRRFPIEVIGDIDEKSRLGGGMDEAVLRVRVSGREVGKMRLESLLEGRRGTHVVDVMRHGILGS